MFFARYQRANAFYTLNKKYKNSRMTSHPPPLLFNPSCCFGIGTNTHTHIPSFVCILLTHTKKLLFIQRVRPLKSTVCEAVICGLQLWFVEQGKSSGLQYTPSSCFSFSSPHRLSQQQSFTLTNT